MVITDKEKIIAAITVDRLFKAYEIEMDPEEAKTFAELAPLAGVRSNALLAGMIDAINRAVPPIDFGSEFPQTGKPHHAFSIGRHRGQRIVTVSLSNLYFKPGFDVIELVKEVQWYGQEAGAEIVWVPENNMHSVQMFWPEPEVQS